MNIPLTALVIAAPTLSAVALYLILTKEKRQNRHKLANAREALTKKLHTLFEVNTEEAKHFRQKMLYHLPQHQRNTAKNQMLNEARHWTPTKTEPAPPNYYIPDSKVYSGKLYGLHTEVTMKNSLVMDILIEVD